MRNRRLRRISAIRIGKRFRAEVGDVRTLADSIARVGLLHPIVIDARGRLLAGARRLEAVKMLGWPEVPVTVVRSLTDAADALRAERDENVERKAFLPSEMVDIARALEPLERSEAKKRLTHGGRPRGGQKRAGKLPDHSTGNTRDKLAAVVGVSGRTLDKARAVVEAAERQPRRYAALLEQMDRTGNVTAAFNALRRVQRRYGRHVRPLPAGKFRVLLADPPFDYGNNDLIRAGRHYRTMTIEQICALPVADLAADDAVLFLWIPVPLLMRAQDVIEAWGFVYKSGIVWDKIAHHVGQYVSLRHEHLLICTRGSCVPDRVTPMIDSVVSIRKSKVHSEKPTEFRQIIDRLYPFGRRLELFGRGRAPTGWTMWGDDALPHGESQTTRVATG